MRGLMTPTRTWTDLSHSDEYRGLWVALDNCRYDDATGKPLEGDVVDADAELAQLCARMKKKGRGSCAILFCGENVRVEPHPDSSRPLLN